MPKPLPPHPNVCKCIHIKVSGQQCGSPRGTQKTPASTTSITGPASNRWCARSPTSPAIPDRTPRIRPPIEPRSAGAPAREAATAVQRETQAEPRAAEQNATQKSTTTDPAAERRKNAAHGASRGKNPKTIQLRRSERTLAIHPRTRSRTRKKTNGSNQPKPRSTAQWQETGAISAPYSSSPESANRAKKPLRLLSRPHQNLADKRLRGLRH